MNRENPPRVLALALVLCVSAAPTFAAVSPDAGAMGRLPADRKAHVQQLLTRLPDAAAARLSAAITDFDRHSTYWQSLKWAASSGGAILGPIFASVGIAAAGKVLGATALEAMAWGGPIIWGIGATAGLGGAAALVYYEHSKHWYPKALTALDAALAEADRAAAAWNGNGTRTAALPSGTGNGQPMGLLGVSAQR